MPAAMPQQVHTELKPEKTTLPSKKAAGAFKTISEVADDLDLQQHVLRFWETKFSQIRPLKRGGGRRYYRPEDLALLKRIHHLLYTEGYTIKGVQKLLKEKGKALLMQEPTAPAQNSNIPQGSTKITLTPPPTGQENGETLQRRVLQDTLEDLLALRKIITG